MAGFQLDPAPVFGAWGWQTPPGPARWSPVRVRLLKTHRNACPGSAIAAGGERGVPPPGAGEGLGTPPVSDNRRWKALCNACL